MGNHLRFFTHILRLRGKVVLSLFAEKQPNLGRWCLVVRPAKTLVRPIGSFSLNLRRLPGHLVVAHLGLTSCLKT